MNEKPRNSFISRKVTEEKLLKDACTTTDFADTPAHDVQATARSTTYHRTRSTKFSMRKMFQAFKSYIISSEDDITLQCTSKKGYSDIDNEPVFVLVESSSLTSPSSQEILVESKRHDKEPIFRGKSQKHLKQGVVIPFDTPSTSKDHRLDVKSSEIHSFESKDELQMADINLQSENDIPLDDTEIDNESIVLSYLKNKDAFLDREGIILSAKKKFSLLRSVPKMETILEGEQFSSFPLSKSESTLSPVRSMSKQNYLPK
nr:uncharacterized protein LOC128675290 isoform X3 [Plodia interpunctella]